MEALRTKGGQPIWKDGLCTSYLASRLPGARIDAVLKRTKVKIRPDDVKKSFVMVSCGTGIAPIRSLLYALSSTNTRNSPVPSQGAQTSNSMQAIRGPSSRR